MEDYAAKMLLKPDAALREYVTGHAQYREEAVLAALAELRRRGQPAPEEAALLPGLEAAEADHALAAAEAAKAAPVLAAEGEAPTGPALYSPGTITIFTVLFPVVGGAALLAFNLVKLRRWAGLGLLALFTGGYLVLAGLVLVQLLGGGQAVLLFLPIVLALPAILVYVRWFWPRYCGATAYQGRGWVLPLVIGMLLQLGLHPLNDYLIKHQPKEVQVEMNKLLGK